MLLRCLPWVGAGTVRAAYTSSCFAPRAHACGGVFWSKPARLARSKIINRSIEGGRRPHPIRPTDASQPRSTIDRQAQSPSVRLPLGLGSRGRKEMQDDGGGPGRRRRVFWLLRAARVARANTLLRSSPPPKKAPPNPSASRPSTNKRPSSMSIGQHRPSVRREKSGTEGPLSAESSLSSSGAAWVWGASEPTRGGPARISWRSPAARPPSSFLLPLSWRRG